MQLQETVRQKRVAHEDRLADILQDEITSVDVDTSVSVGQFLAQLTKSASDKG
jgi:predicted chitinase